MEKGTILLIDDDLDMLLIGQRIFGRAGFTFISARTGREGLEKVKAEKPDLILLDFILPDVNGRQFLETLAFDEDYSDCADIPVVILSARADFIDDLDRFYELGLGAYLNKPFGHRELTNVVDNIIRSHRAKKHRQPIQTTESEKQKAEDSISIDTSQTEDIIASARTIFGLCNIFLETHNRNLSDSQRIELLAVSNSCKNLVKLVEKATSQTTEAQLVA